MILDRVLAGRILFTPTADGSGYIFEAPTSYDKLFSGIATPRPSFIDGDAGTEDISVADTPEADYGRLVERAVRNVVNERGWRPHRDSSLCGRHPSKEQCVGGEASPERNRCAAYNPRIPINARPGDGGSRNLPAGFC
jgi:hypothetical protein